MGVGGGGWGWEENPDYLLKAILILVKWSRAKVVGNVYSKIHWTPKQDLTT